MYPFNFLAAVMTLAVTVFYLVINWQHPSRGGKQYPNYRNAFCLNVIFLSLIQIIRAFAPLEQQNLLLKLGVSSLSLMLFLQINIFEIISGRNPKLIGKAIAGLMGIVAFVALFLPGGGYWGEATFTKDILFDNTVFIRPVVGASDYRELFGICGILGLGYKLFLSWIAARQQNRRTAIAMMIVTLSEILIMTWNALCGYKVIIGNVAPGLFGIPGVVLFMWIDRANQTSLTQENKRLGDRNRAQTAMLDALVRHGAFSCAQFDDTGRLISKNDNFNHYISPRLTSAFKPQDQSRTLANPTDNFWHGLELAINGSVHDQTITWSVKEGDSITYRARFIPFKPTAAEAHHVIVCLTDITEALNSRQQLMEAKHLQAIGMLASGVAHEYNNILTGVIAMSELALREAVNDHQRSHLEIVVQAARRCTDLSSNLLSLSRSSPRQNEPIDLSDILDETIKLVRHSRGVTIKLPEAIHAEAHIAIVGNRNELATLLLNLMINACDAMDNQGTITLRIDYTQIENPETSTEPIRHVVLQISDSGPGIPEEIIPHIFEPFFTTKRLGKGSGLGLATAKAIATAHGGNIEAKYNPGGGAVFEITLPLFAGRPMRSQSPFPILHPSAQQSGQAAVIDDDPIVLATSANVLNDLGYQVAAYSSAEKFLETYTPEAQAAIKLAVIDIRMPGMDGVQLCRRLLTISSRLKIILVTGFTEKYDTAKLGQLRNVSILMKPFSLTALQNLIIEIETQAALKGDESMT